MKKVYLETCLVLEQQSGFGAWCLYVLLIGMKNTSFVVEVTLCHVLSRNPVTQNVTERDHVITSRTVAVPSRSRKSNVTERDASLAFLDPS